MSDVRRAIRLWSVVLLATQSMAWAQEKKPPPVPPESALSGAERKAFVAKVQKAMTKAQTVAATFVQEKHYSLFEGVVSHHGFILYRRPDQLRWEIQRPFRSILVVSGRELGKFEFKGGKRRKLALGPAKDVLRIVMDQIRSWFQGEFEKGNSDYSASFFAGSTKLSRPPRVVLVPTSKTLKRSIQAFELALTDDLGSVASVTIRETGGDKTVMKFQPMPKGQLIQATHFSVADPAAFIIRPAKQKKPKAK